MKKITTVIVILGVLLLATITTLVIYVVKFSKLTTNYPERGITLNNIESGIADDMVSSFRGNKNCSDKKTAFWLDKAWVDNICTIIKNEHGDGIRLYFAKQNGKNSIVFVSTYRVGPDNHSESLSDHRDYYDHVDPFFKTDDAKLIPDSANDPQALLFGPQPGPCPANCFIISSTNNNHIKCSDAYKAVNNCEIDSKINTYSEWFPLKVFQDISADKNVDGIRIYYAKHTDSTTDNKSHQNRHAFIIITTVKYPVGNITYHRDYFDCYDISYFTKANDSSNDNGEQCLNNCSGNSLPSN